MKRDGKWTDEQWQAITSRGTNLLVAAAAGAGKTAVLVERIIGLIRSGIDVDRLLVVTFTNAAATEMRERIGTAISKELLQSPEQVHLRQQLVLLNRAQITTLHSFCLDTLRKHYYRLDLDPTFRVADDTETALLRQDVLEQLFESLYESADEQGTAFAQLVDAYGGDRDDEALQEIVLQLYDKAQSQPWPERWLREAAEAFRNAQGGDIEQLPWLLSLREELMIDLAEVEGRLSRALAHCRLPAGPSTYSDALLGDLQMVQDLRLAAENSWDNLYVQFQGLKHMKFKPSKSDVDEAVKKQVVGWREQAKKKLKFIKDTYFTREPEELAADLNRVFPFMDTLINLVLDFGKEFQKVKVEKRLVDFSDLEHYCLRILLDESSEPGCLVPSSVAMELRDYFQEVLVDEYQDINAVQETILELVSRTNRFMVGDVKQSIYRFRLAEPGLFMEKSRRYASMHPDGTEQSITPAGRRIDLAKNFRSRSNLVQGVNFLFRKIMTFRSGEMDYDAKAELVYGANYPLIESLPDDPAIEVHVIQRQPFSNQDPGLIEAYDETLGSLEVEGGEDDEGEDGLQELNGAQLEARLIARRIKELVGETGGNPQSTLVYDKDQGKYRPVMHRDIVVLLRATKGTANIFLEEFRTAGIPAYAELGTGYFEATEISIMLSLLKIIDNPRQDIPLVAALRSPIFRFTAQELARIRLLNKQGSFYEAASILLKRIKAGERGPELVQLGNRVQGFFSRLDQWRTWARRGSLAQLIWQIYQETGFYDYVGGMPGGSQRQANLRALHYRARQFEATSYRGLFRFLRFIERLQDQGGDLGTARALGEKENVVRIMSIHKSKGLEFPVVFVAGMGKQFNLQDMRKGLLVHKSLGLGPMVVDPSLRYRYPTIAKLAIQRKLQREALAEELRILYVALTRAKEKLLLVGTVKELAKAVQQWCQEVRRRDLALPDEMLLRAKTYLDWLCPALARHRDGHEFRSRAGEVEVAGEDELSRWQVHFRDNREFGGCDEPSDLEVDHPYREWMPKLRELEPVTDSQPVASYLSWKYPYRNSSGIPAKVTVSQVKHRFDPSAGQETDGVAEEEEYVFTVPFGLARQGFKDGFGERRPRFLQADRQLSGSERGSVVHTVMQHLDFSRQLSLAGIREQIDDLVRRELLTVAQALAVNESEIFGFVNHPLGQRLMRAKQMMREVPFSLSLPVAEVFPHKDLGGEDETLVLQGVIDCLFDEGDGWVLLDYKTDRMGTNLNPTDWFADVKKRYQGQIRLYQRAVETILPVTVKERYLYLFSVEQAMSM